jgi:hypothetical protein
MDYHPSLTYQDIKDWVNTKTEDELDQTATVYFEDSEKSYPVSFIRKMVDVRGFEDGRLVLSVDAIL